MLGASFVEPQNIERDVRRAGGLSTCFTRDEREVDGLGDPEGVKEVVQASTGVAATAHDLRR